MRIVEQNARDSTFGFGVVFSERALEFLRGDDPETYERITPAMEAWTDITVVHRGTPVVIDGIGFTGIMVAFCAVVAATFLFSNFPRVKVPRRSDLNTGDVRHMVARTELWLESQRHALPAPAVTLCARSRACLAWRGRRGWRGC